MGIDGVVPLDFLWGHRVFLGPGKKHRLGPAREPEGRRVIEGGIRSPAALHLARVAGDEVEMDPGEVAFVFVDRLEDGAGVTGIGTLPELRAVPRRIGGRSDLAEGIVAPPVVDIAVGRDDLVGIRHHRGPLVENALGDGVLAVDAIPFPAVIAALVVVNPVLDVAIHVPVVALSVVVTVLVDIPQAAIADVGVGMDDRGEFALKGSPALREVGLRVIGTDGGRKGGELVPEIPAFPARGETLGTLFRRGRGRRLARRGGIPARRRALEVVADRDFANVDPLAAVLVVEGKGRHFPFACQAIEGHGIASLIRSEGRNARPIDRGRGGKNLTAELQPEAGGIVPVLVAIDVDPLEDVRRIEALKQGGEVIGNRTRVKVVKNKIAPPFKEAEFDIMFGEGISMTGDILDLAASIDVVNKSGAWYAYNGSKIGQGRENAKQYLKDNPEVCQEIAKKVRAHFGLDGAGDHSGEAAAQEKKEAKPARSKAAE